jgi:hypothetical protein
MENTLENAKLFMKRRISLHLQGGDARQKQITRAMFEYANEVLLQHSVVRPESASVSDGNSAQWTLVCVRAISID